MSPSIGKTILMKHTATFAKHKIFHRTPAVILQITKADRKDGLCWALVEICNAMAELPLKAEYRDYLAYSCTALRGGKMRVPRRMTVLLQPTISPIIVSPHGVLHQTVDVRESQIWKTAIIRIGCGSQTKMTRTQSGFEP